MFLGDASMRNKFNLILCEAMTPMLPADDYMDKGEYENELKQVTTTKVNHCNMIYMNILSIVCRGHRYVI